MDGDTLAHMNTNANLNHHARVALLCLLAWLPAACSPTAQEENKPQVDSPVVAKVGQVPIYEVDIDYEILSMPASMRHLMKDEGARAKILQVLVQREAVAQRAVSMGLDKDPLLQHRIHQATNSVLIQAVRDWQKQEDTAIDDASIAAYYKAHQDDFRIPEQIHVRHILVSSKQKAWEIYKMVKRKPDSFPALAAQYSIDDSNKGRGGDLNWFARGVMVKPFEDAAFALSTKHPLSKPVKTKFGWHIIQWLGKKEGSMPGVDEVRDEIISILRKQAFDAWLQKLMDEADIDILKAEYQTQP